MRCGSDKPFKMRQHEAKRRGIERIKLKINSSFKDTLRVRLGAKSSSSPAQSFRHRAGGEVVKVPKILIVELSHHFHIRISTNRPTSGTTR
jgi:hypothetical protein